MRIDKSTLIMLAITLLTVGCTTVTERVDPRTNQIKSNFRTSGDWGFSERAIKDVPQPPPVEDGLPSLPGGGVGLEALGASSFDAGTTWPSQAQWGYRSPGGSVLWGSTLDHSTHAAVSWGGLNTALRNTLVFLGFARAAESVDHRESQDTERFKSGQGTDRLGIQQEARTIRHRDRQETLRQVIAEP